MWTRMFFKNVLDILGYATMILIWVAVVILVVYLIIITIRRAKGTMRPEKHPMRTKLDGEAFHLNKYPLSGELHFQCIVKIPLKQRIELLFKNAISITGIADARPLEEPKFEFNVKTEKIGGHHCRKQR